MPMPRALKLFWAVVAVAFAAFTIRTLIWGNALTTVFDLGVSNFLLASGSASCLLRVALVPHDRAPWLAAGLGLALWTCGDVFWTVSFVGDPDAAPYPSLADPLYLAMYPAFYAALLLLVRSRKQPLAGGLWLDGAIGALAFGAVVATVAVGPIIAATTGSGAAVAVSLAYPILDLTLLMLIVAAFGVSGWRPGRAWILLGAGFALTAIADVIYFFQATLGSGYEEGTPLGIMWPSAGLLIGLAAWQRSDINRDTVLEGSRVIAIPLLGASVAVALMVVDHFTTMGGVALGLTTATLVLVVARMAMAFRDREQVLERSRTEALVDALTGLRNRRSLMADLDRELPTATAARPQALLLFDLDGFKGYNDTYGHLAGDAMLTRLGDRLNAAVDGSGRAYRLGGDEFCALVTPGVGLDAIAAACVAALSESGEGFHVATSYGIALIPEEASEPVDALKLADRRMYAQKDSGRSSAGRQSRDVLMSTLSERQPALHAHLRSVGELAVDVGRQLEMGAETLDELARAAELHDVGKMAIPDEILNKTGPLTDHEWGFMRRHTIIGERILLAAPALQPVARLVRSSHERWEGGGYPDDLSGDEIPLGSRVVAVCDAFDAMTTDRSYRKAMSEREAVAELMACAGTQFDPVVVESFCHVLAARNLDGAVAATAP